MSGGEEDRQVRSQEVKSAETDLVLPLAAHQSVFSSMPGLRLGARHQHAHGSSLSPHHRVWTWSHDTLSECGRAAAHKVADRNKAAFHP